MSSQMTPAPLRHAEAQGGKLRLVAVGRAVAGGEVEWQIAPAPLPLEEQLDTAIAVTAATVTANLRLLDELRYLNAVADALQSGRRVPRTHLSAADLEACEAEPIGGEQSRQPYLW